MWVAEVHPCDMQCEGGCNGPLSSNCVACSSVKFANGTCGDKCDVGSYAAADGEDFVCKACGMHACQACMAEGGYVYYKKYLQSIFCQITQ